MTIKDMKEAGRIASYFSFTDKELKKSINALKLVIAYLEERDTLLCRSLRTDLITLENMKDSRET